MPMNLSALDAAIVDLDGTMVDTLGDFEQALAATLADLALPAVDRSFISRTVGRGSQYLLARSLEHVRRGARPIGARVGALPGCITPGSTGRSPRSFRAFARGSPRCARVAGASPA